MCVMPAMTGGITERDWALTIRNLYSQSYTENIFLLVLFSPFWAFLSYEALRKTYLVEDNKSLNFVVVVVVVVVVPFVLSKCRS